ncbi:MAG: formylglycine-generating enzyme family protein [Candidatus Latescibacterota bacterium]
MRQRVSMALGVMGMGLGLSASVQDGTPGDLSGSVRLVTTPAGTRHEMVVVPAGLFTMGADSARSDERPAHAVSLGAFSIDRYEVSNAHYRAYAEATGHAPAAHMANTQYNEPQQPVVGVTWSDAEGYCRWAGLRLPTEAEWEKAARGTDGRTFPWGEELDRTRANYGSDWGTGADASDGSFSTGVVGGYPAGRSPYGADDMAGNVWEWVADWYGAEYHSSPDAARDPHGPAEGTLKVLRGGSWQNGKSSLRCAARWALDPETDYVFAGFRCAGN